MAPSPLHTPSGPQLLGPKGGPLYVRPEPNELTEQRVREQLKRLDGLLDIKWFPTAVYNDTHDCFEGRYGLIVQWPSNDPRWKLYREGEIGEPFDLLGWFCEDVQDASSVPVDPEAVRVRTRELLARCDNQRESWKTRMRRVFEHNENRREEVKQEAQEYAREAAQDVYRHGRQFESGELDTTEA